MSEKEKDEKEFTVKRLVPFFVDDVANISISPNGSSRIYFISWQSDESGEPLRVDSEIIMTTKTLTSLANNLPKAIRQASEILKSKRVNKNQEGILCQ